MRTSEPVPYEWWWIRVTSDNDATGGDRTEGVSVNFTTVVFDLGQVVVDWNPAKAHPDLSASEHAEIADLIDFASYNLRADAGERWSDLDAEVASLWPEHSGFLLTYARNFPAALVGEIPGTSSLIEELSALNVRLLGLTNWSSETFPHAAAAIGQQGCDGSTPPGLKRQGGRAVHHQEIAHAAGEKRRQHLRRQFNGNLVHPVKLFIERE